MAYVAPNWVNGGPPALDAEALNAISQALAKLPMENGGTFATSGAAGLYNLINAAATLTSGTLASGDYVGIKDVSAGTGKQVTLSNLASWIGSNGTGAKIATGSYTGTGTYGSSNPNSITFPFTPKLVIILKYNTTYGAGIGYNFTEGFLWVHGIPTIQTRFLNGSNDIERATNRVTLSGTRLSWYQANSTYGGPDPQMNGTNVQYRWVALG